MHALRMLTVTAEHSERLRKSNSARFSDIIFQVALNKRSNFKGTSATSKPKLGACILLLIPVGNCEYPKVRHHLCGSLLYLLFYPP